MAQNCLAPMWSTPREVVMILDDGKIDVWDSEAYHNEFDMTPEELNKLNEAIHLGQFNTARKEEGNDIP